MTSLFKPIDISGLLPAIIFLICSIFAQGALKAAPSDAFAATESEEQTADSVLYLLDELDVVAAKHNVAFRNLAISGTMIGKDESERLHMTDVKSLSSIVPNFYIPDYGSRITSTIYVRGIGARMDQPAVGLTIDNVGILNKDAYDFDINDIAYLEMLRGPQSALFGRNTMTGLVNIRTLSPMEYTGWRGLLEIGLRSLFKFNLGWYHRFRSNLGLSITGSFYRRNGEFINEYDGYSLDKEVNGQLRVKFVWSPRRDLHISNTFSESLLRQGGYPYENVATGQIAYNDTCFYKRALLTDALTISKQFANLKLISVTSTQYIHDNMTLDQDFLPDPYFTLTQKKLEKAFTEDLMLRGTAAEGRYSWLAGVYGFYRHMDMTAPVTFKQQGIESLIEANRNRINPYYPIGWDEDQFVLDSHFKMPSYGVALYHESRYQMDNWRFTAGLRLDYEHIAMRYDNACNTSYTIYDNPSGQLPVAEGAEVYNKVPVDLSMEGMVSNKFLMFLPKVSVMYEIPSMVASNAYVSLGEGYKAGGFNTQMFSDILQQKLMNFMGLGREYDVKDIISYKPEKSWTFEIGTHINLLDSRMNLDMSLFGILCHDQQMTVFPHGETTGRMMTNAGRTYSLGGEISAYYTPLPDFTLMATYGYTNARFLKFNDGKSDYKGNRLPYAPANTLFAEASYMLDVSSRRLREHYFSFHLNFSGTGDIYWNEANTLHQKFYGLLGGSIGYHTPRWSVDIWGKNLTATKYYTFYFLSMGNEFRQRGRGIDLGASIRATF